MKPLERENLTSRASNAIEHVSSYSLFSRDVEHYVGR